MDVGLTTANQDPAREARRPSRRRRPGAGAFVVLVGPDGVGKTTVARALMAHYAGPAAYFHFRPPVYGTLHPEPPRQGAQAKPPAGRGGVQVLGWLRLARNFAQFWLGYMTVVRPAVRRGCLVVGDRWAYGYLTQPRALKFYGPAALAERAIRALPRPDLVANLRAAPELIFGRKQELTLAEIEAEIAAWERLPEPALATFDAAPPADVIARRILECL